MALSGRQLTQIRMMLGNLSLRSRRDLRAALRGADWSDPTSVAQILSGVWGDIIQTYGDASQALGGVMFQMMADDIAITPKMLAADDLNMVSAHRRMQWAVTQPAASGLLENILDELVKQPARDVIRKSSVASGVAWARVPQGAKTCSFCLTMASRGAVYRTRAKAGDRFAGNEFHGFCDCAVVPLKGPEDYPEGYDPDDLYSKYLTAKEKAEEEFGGYADSSAIFSKLREQQGLKH